MCHQRVRQEERYRTGQSNTVGLFPLFLDSLRLMLTKAFPWLDSTILLHDGHPSTMSQESTRRSDKSQQIQ